MSVPNIDQKIFEDLFRRLHVIASVTLRSSKDKGDNFDPFRQTGFEETYQNPLPVKVLKKAISASGLTYYGLGLVKSGAIQIILSNDDVDLIKNSASISINNNSYYVHDEAVGNRFQIYPTEYTDYSKIILFLRDAGS